MRVFINGLSMDAQKALDNGLITKDKLARILKARQNYANFKAEQMAFEKAEQEAIKIKLQCTSCHKVETARKSIYENSYRPVFFPLFF